MKIEKQILDDHQVKLVVEADQGPFDEAKQRAARKLAKKVKIPGFRPGKAPYPVIIRHIGESAIVEEAIELLVNDIYPDAISQAEIEPYSIGSLENIPSLDPPIFEFVIPLKAEVELGNYKDLRLPYTQPSIDEADIEEVVDNLRERQAVIEPIEEPAKEGNLVRIRLEGERATPEEGESPVLISDREYPVVIEAGEEDQTEWPFPGFSRHLLGLSAGEQSELEYTFPDDTEYDTLKGENTLFKVSVEQVNTRTLPELDDEFASSVGEYATLEDLRAAIRQELEGQAELSYNEGYDEELIVQIVDISTVKYPPQMLEQEIENVINRLENNLAQQGLDMDLYLKSRQMDIDALKEEVTPVAETRLQKSLVLLELADAEDIQIEPDELQSATNRTLGELSNYMQKKDFKRMIQTDEARSNLVGNVMMDMLIDRTQARIRDIARGALEEQATGEETEPDEVAAVVPDEIAAEAVTESDAAGTEQEGTKTKKPAKKPAKRKKAEKQDAGTAGQIETETADQKKES